MNQISRPTSRIVGPNPTSNCCQIGAGASGGFAFTGTPLACSLANRLSSGNDGRWVVNRATSLAVFDPVGVYDAFLVNVASMGSPVEGMSATLRASTWVRK